MNSSYNKLPVLVIEDDSQHANKIQERLGDLFQVEHLTSVDPIQLYNYKAINQGGQIIIVDLVLETQDDAHEGFRTIRRDLWPLDRTAFFIVFSQYLEDKTIPSLNRFEPHWAFVKKELSPNNNLSTHCLDNLYRIVEQCADYASPVMETPQYRVSEWTQQVRDYDSRFNLVDSREIVVKNIERSVDVLNDLAKAAAQYTKAGRPSKEIAIGVFGSCGRMEMRVDSDIECSVYYSDDTNNIVASTFWNRITRYISSKGWPYEGQEEVENSPSGFLLPSQVGESFENKFIPLIAKQKFLEADLNVETQVRDRHFQILTELRPIFNPAFILDMKREMILKNCQTPDLRAVIDSTYMKQIVAQYFMDVQPESFSDWQGLKRFCYRTLNIFALQLFFIGRLLPDINLRFQKDEDWNEFFSLLCDPGIVKIIQFEQECLRAKLSTKKQNRALMAEIQELVRGYFEIYSRFVETQNDERVALRKVAGSTIEHFVNLLEQMKQIELFKPVLNQAKWLFETEKVADLKSQLA
jgi:predicted nucleotidyltransferase